MQIASDALSGQPIEVACATCHSTREPDLEHGALMQLEQFHQQLQFQHGSLACLSCHDAGNYDRLRLANSASLEFADSMQLCAQCHAKRHTDYQHGAHGGMNGHWDLSRGERTRKHCIECHDPHWPKFPKMRPTFKPIDRFLDAHKPDQQAPQSHG